MFIKGDSHLQQHVVAKFQLFHCHFEAELQIVASVGFHHLFHPSCLEESGRSVGFCLCPKMIAQSRNTHNLGSRKFYTRMPLERLPKPPG